MIPGATVLNIDQIILGDNQFFGVNHSSQDRGRQTYEQFKDISEIKKIIYTAMDYGVKGIFFSTHPAVYQIMDMIRADLTLKKELSFYVNVPYIIKYVQMLNEMGMIRTVKTVLSGKSALENSLYMLNTGFDVLTNNYLSVANRIIDVELNPFHDLNVKAVFLHNSLVDLAIGYKLTRVLQNFYDYIAKKYHVIPAFGTINYPLLCKELNKADINEALVMTSVNKKGFIMNPSRAEVEKAIVDNNHTILAMGTLASGSIHPEEAYEYLFSIKKIKHVVVGLSSKKHADETFGILRKYLS